MLLLDVNGVEELHQRCLDAGAKITAPLTRQTWGNYDLVLADRDGHQLAFGEVPAAPAGGAAQGRADWGS